MEKQEIEELATRTLSDAGIHCFPVDQFTIGEAEGLLTSQSPEMPRGVDAALLPGWSRHMIVVNCLLPRVRRRFIWAHMLGHLLMHDPVPRMCSLCKVPLWAECREEREASLFAAYTLMPRSWVESMHRCGMPHHVMAQMMIVSPEALQIHLEDLGIVESRQSRLYREEAIRTA